MKLNNRIPPKKQVKIKFNLSWKTILLYSFLFFIILFLSVALSGDTTFSPSKTIPISQVISDIKDNKISSVTVLDTKLNITYKNDEKVVSHKEPGASIYEILKNANVDPTKVKILVKDDASVNAWINIISSFLPVLLMVAFFYFLFRQARGAQENIFSFGSSKARAFNKDFPNTTFADVAGVDEAKQELSEVVDFLKHPEKYRAMGARTPKGVLLVGPSGTGKCITGDTLIWTNKGLMEIREVPRYYYVDPKTNQVYGAGLASFDIEKVNSKDNFASHWFDLGEQKTIKIKLSQGFSLEGTPEHPIVVMTNDGMLKFRKLEDIQEGDYITIQFGSEIFGNLKLVDEDTAYLMGILTGDGNMSHASRIGLTNVDDEIISFFKTYITTHYPQSAISIRGQSYLVSSWDLKKHLYQMGMSYLLSFDKIVPPTILQAPKEIQVAFLRGLFDTDASIGKKRAEFEYTTVSGRMARQVQLMLLNLGVVASLNIKGKKENGYYRSVYRITMTGSSLVNFSTVVGFRLSRKQKLVEDHVKRMGRVNTNIDIIPYIAHIVEQSWRVLSLKKLSNENLSKTIDKVRRRIRISRQTLSDYVAYAVSLSVEVPHLEYLRSLLEAKLFFSQVVMKTTGFQRVFDFTVPKTHSFLGNGFINHNTLLARAVAGEARVPFFSIAGSEFMEMLVGVGAARVRDLFLTAKKSQPAIIFIDEVDAIGRQRGAGFMGGHDEREQTLNQILVEMDGFNPTEQLVVMAATNRPDVLDPALIRPGRFDRRILVGLPDIEGRKEILAIHAKNKPFEKGIDWEKVARRTVGYSGADLENMLNEAAILAARLGRKAIDMTDLEEAATKVKMGPEKKRMQTDDDKKITAFHESGHAIVSFFMPHTDKVHRISIVGRGMSLGHTLIPPSHDRIHETKSRLLQQIATMLGGRAAEELVFSEVTTGAADDIEKATELAKSMVVDYGMSELGPISFDSDNRRMMYEKEQISENMQSKIDNEIKRIMEEGHKTALRVLKGNREKLDEVATLLIKKETVDGDEFEKIMKTDVVEKKSSPEKSS